MTSIICITCPKGCRLSVDEENGYKVTGNGCPRGEIYGKNELQHPGELALPQCADIEIVVKDSLHSHKRPCSLDFPPGRPALGLPAHLLRHARRRHALLGQVVGNLLVAPAIIVVEIKNPAHNICFGRHDLKLLLSVDDVAIRCGAQPFAVRLPPFDNIADLA